MGKRAAPQPMPSDQDRELLEELQRSVKRLRSVAERAYKGRLWRAFSTDGCDGWIKATFASDGSAQVVAIAIAAEHQRTLQLQPKRT